MRTFFLLGLMIFLQGCFGSTDSQNSGGSGGIGDPIDRSDETLKECGFGASERADLHSLFESTDHSIHELIKCGGVQSRLARNFLAILIASNESLFRGDSYDQLVDVADKYGIDLTIPVEQQSDGRWTLPLSVGADSLFTIEFFEPSVETRITEDPFDIETYVTGVYGDSTVDVDTLFDCLDCVQALSLEWVDRGPLAHLLEDENGGIPNPILIRFSVFDLAALVFGWSFGDSTADFGAIKSLQDAEMRSDVVINDTRGSYVVTYRADSGRDTLKSIAGSNRILFDLSEIGVKGETISAVGDASAFAFLDGDLSGEIHFSIEGASRPVTLTIDYGNGQAWGTPRWSCD